MTGLKRFSGIFLILTGALHTGIGVLLLGGPLRAIADEGFLNALQTGEWEQLTAFWFIMFGFLLVLLGALMHWVLRTLRTELPPFLGWGLLAICAVGVILLPVSGFWICIPQAWLIMRRSKA